MDPRFKIVYPNVYDETEQQVINQLKQYMSDDQNKVMDLIARQMNGETFYPGLELNSAFRPSEYTIGSHELSTTAGKINPYNPLYNDIQYAKETKYGRILSAPMAVNVSAGFPYMPKETPAWVWVLDENVPNVKGGLDHEMSFYKPIGAGDTVRTVVTRQDFEDITEPGSEYRWFRMIGEGDLYNQNDEVVAHIRHTSTEHFHVFSDPKYAEEFKGTTPHHSTVRRYRNWDKARPWHTYTDEEWEIIKNIWKNEYIRGADTLYWEDVNIGDEPAPTADGPFPDDGMKMPPMGGSISVRDALTKDPAELFKGPPGMPPMPGAGGTLELGKDKHGIITVSVKRNDPGGPGGPGGMTGKTRHPNERSSFQNTDGRDYCVRVVTNWMGDEGWLHKFCWRLTSDTTHNKYPEDFDRPSYLLKVPYLKEQGKFMTTHGFAGDVSINRAYVCDKYIQDGKHYVDLVVWGETVDGEIYTECYAVVELPSREA